MRPTGWPRISSCESTWARYPNRRCRWWRDPCWHTRIPAQAVAPDRQRGYGRGNAGCPSSPSRTSCPGPGAGSTTRSSIWARFPSSLRRDQGGAGGVGAMSRKRACHRRRGGGPEAGEHGHGAARTAARARVRPGPRSNRRRAGRSSGRSLRPLRMGIPSEHEHLLELNEGGSSASAVPAGRRDPGTPT